MFVENQGVRIHFTDYGGTGKPLVCLHGLTTNAHQFDRLLRTPLIQAFRVITLDLRGRGDSDKPDVGYMMQDHANDVVALITALHLEDVVLVGHSFGGLLAMYMGAYCSEQLNQLVVMDAALALTKYEVVDAIKPVLTRLGKTIPSMDDHLNSMRSLAIFQDAWDDDIETLYRADVETLPDGSVRSRSSMAAMTQAIEGVLAVDWVDAIQSISQPTLLIRGIAPQGTADAPPMLSAAAARETVDLLPDCTYGEVGGNHHTMLFGDNADEIARMILDFVG